MLSVPFGFRVASVCGFLFRPGSLLSASRPCQRRLWQFRHFRLFRHFAAEESVRVFSEKLYIGSKSAGVTLSSSLVSAFSLSVFSVALSGGPPAIKSLSLSAGGGVAAGRCCCRPARACALSRLVLLRTRGIVWFFPCSSFSGSFLVLSVTVLCRSSAGFRMWH
jgi:hypothetical protein